eukprot:scpid56536/ scgid22174/ 
MLSARRAIARPDFCHVYTCRQSTYLVLATRAGPCGVVNTGQHLHAVESVLSCIFSLQPSCPAAAMVHRLFSDSKYCQHGGDVKVYSWVSDILTVSLTLQASSFLLQNVALLQEQPYLRYLLMSQGLFKRQLFAILLQTIGYCNTIYSGSSSCQFQKQAVFFTGIPQVERQALTQGFPSALCSGTFQRMS